MRSRRSIVLRWLVVFGLAGLIYLVSELPKSALPFRPFPHFDKVLHFGVYWVLAAALFRALWADEERPVPVGVLLLGVVLAMLYGMSDEFHQSFSGREFDVVDMAANGVGAAVAAAIWEPLTERLPQLR